MYKSPHIDIIPQDVESALCTISMANGGNNINTGSGGIGEEEQLSKGFFFYDALTIGSPSYSNPSSNNGYTFSNPWEDDNSTPIGNGSDYND